MGDLIELNPTLPSNAPHDDVLHVLRLLRAVKVSKEGELLSVTGSLAAVEAILRIDPWTRHQITHDDLAYSVLVHGEPVTDETTGKIAIWMEKIYRCKVAASRVHEVICVIASDARFHPVRRWLDTLQWDGVPRLDKMLTTYFGAEDAPLHREYARRWMISACARARKPGCKVDTALILVGAQGAGKSSSIAILCGEQWFNSTQIDLTDAKAAAEKMMGVWIYELGELSTLRRGDFAAIKQALTTQVDKFRPAYGRCTVARPRTCVFIGTTNEQTVLTDSTGSRRFWCVGVGACDRVGLEEDRDQLWAEADAAYRSGERWWLDADIEKERIESAQAFERVDPWIVTIERAIETSFSANGIDLMQLVEAVEQDVGRRTTTTVHRVADCLRALGYAPQRARSGGEKTRRWVKS